MDSPERTPIASTKSSSSPVQDSPFFNYLSNLSPINPIKASHGVQGFQELNLPSPVFTSPHINQRGRCFVKRSKCPPSSSVVQSLEHGSREKLLKVGPPVCEQPTTQSMFRLVPCSNKEKHSNASEQVQPHSPSDSISEYLTNTVEMGDSAKFTDSVDSRVKQGHVPSQANPSGSVGADENTTLNDDYATKITDVEVAESVTLLDKAEKETLREPLFDIESVDTEFGLKDGSRKVNDFVESNLALESIPAEGDVSTEPYSVEQAYPDTNDQRPACPESLCNHEAQDMLQNAEGGHQGGLDTPQLPSESSQNVLANENLDYTSVAKPTGSVFEEGTQHHRGTRRRCLRFEASQAQGNNACNSLGLWNSTNVLPNSRSPASPAEVETMDSLQLQSTSTSSNRQQANASQPISSRLPLLPVEMPEAHEADRSIKNSVNHSRKAPRSFGIGLHLNGIVNKATMSSTASTSTIYFEKDYSGARREKPSSEVQHELSKDSLIEKFPDNVLVDQQESSSLVRASSTTFQFSHDMKHMDDNLQLQLFEHHMTPSDERKNSLDGADRLEEFNQPYSTKKRKEISNVIESDGCKRCTCKRSKCLKLYCECFAAGIYCAEPCSCQGCFNKPEYEDTVLGTRKQIELRNPLAFAPKIVSRAHVSPAQSGEEVTQITPSSARHKRGCNCKKSMCLKKYCECYQSGVGCCAGCRCEACKNPFGVKEGCGESGEMLNRKVNTEKWGEMYDQADIRNDLFQPGHRHPHNLSPLTPLFETSNHGKETTKSRVTRRYDPTPESGRQMKTNERFSVVAQGSTSVRRDSILQRQNELVDISDLTPVPNVQPTATVSSSLSNVGGREKALRTHVLRGSVSLSSVAPLRWRGSPITPSPLIGENKLSREPDSDSSRLSEILEDDTPEILKDTKTPIKAVKVSSPNQKRVSPPHNHLQEPRASVSPSLKSGRKFVLRSISTFPPLTPYSDAKAGNNEK